MPVAAKQFPTRADLNRLREETDWHLLYKCEVYDTEEKRGVFRLKEFFANDRDKKEILAIALNLPSRIIDAGVDFLFTEDVEITVEDEKWQAKIDDFVLRNDLNMVLEQSAISLQNEGHANFNMRVTDATGKKQAIIEEIPYDNWFPDWSGVEMGGKAQTIRLANYISVQRDGDTTLHYMYIQEISAGKVEHTLWTEFQKQTLQQVPLSTLPSLAAKLGLAATAPDLVVTQATGVGYLTAWQIDTRKTIKDRYGSSVLKPIRPLLETINDRLTQINMQFLKHLEAPLQVPKTAVKQEKDGSVRRANLEVILMGPDDPDAKYVTNSNPLIEEAFKHIESLIEKCADLTSTPRSFLMPDEKGGVESVESLKTRMMGFLTRINRYKKTYRTMIELTIRRAMELEGTPIPVETTIDVFICDGLPKDKTAEASYYTTAHNGGIMSLETAVAGLQDLEGDALDEEMKRIREDQAAMPQFGFGQGGGGTGTGQTPEEIAAAKKKDAAAATA